MKFALFILALIPLAYAATIPMEDEDIDKKMSIDDIFGRLKSLDLSNGCVAACEKNVTKFWTFLCSAACKIVWTNGCVAACEKNVTKFWTFLCSAACKIFFTNVTPATI